MKHELLACCMEVRRTQSVPPFIAQFMEMVDGNNCFEVHHCELLKPSVSVALLRRLPFPFWRPLPTEEGLPFPRRGGRLSESLCGMKRNSRKEIERVVCHRAQSAFHCPRNVLLEHKRLKLLKYWTWQFLVVRHVCSILIITLQLLGLYTSRVSWTFTFILKFFSLHGIICLGHILSLVCQGVGRSQASC
ncbi:uncharacterized protein LOC119363155 isoform X1 [Triticum dicoccoides]|uniref:uncharacterized protein LOC119363155 isoform X1 n=1 Tax=Triticum dicoccoides TaxID=85692 RepID=UPI00189063C7|nr:uncharacterized protein LOC119363155 isoform X1 [Triticum dicoccoides]